MSSIATLSNNEHEVVTESNWFNFSNKKSHYAISKHLGEMEVWRGFSEGLKGFIVNPSLIIGPGDQNSLFGKMIPKIKHNNMLKVASKNTLNLKPSLANKSAGGRNDNKIKIKASLLINPDSGIALTNAD